MRRPRAPQTRVPGGLFLADSETATDKDPIKSDDTFSKSVIIFSRNRQIVSGVIARVSDTELGHLRWHHLAR